MKFQEGWTKFFASQISEPTFKGAAAYVQNQRNNGITIFPPDGKVFDAFAQTQFEDLKAVIMIDEHYTDEQYAGQGLALSVSDDQSIPDTLMNVFHELQRDLGVDIPETGDLSSWAKAGVLLITNNITAKKDKINAHSSIGWQIFTDNLIKYISDNKECIVFAFWGNNVKKRAKKVDTTKHTVLVTSSPSKPYDGFSGCGHLSKINSVCGIWEV